MVNIYRVSVKFFDQKSKVGHIKREKIRYFDVKTSFLLYYYSKHQQNNPVKIEKQKIKGSFNLILGAYGAKSRPRL